MNKYKPQEALVLSKSGSTWNPLGSTAFTTDGSCSVTQGFVYAPFGEIVAEYQGIAATAALPKYAFNAKELDEESGMYYYEARYYKPPVFTSRDPMFEKYFWMSPYAYCANNPVKYVDPSGEEILIFMNTNKPEYKNYRQWEKDNKQRNTNLCLEQFAQKYKDHDDVIHLFAHGNSQGVDLAEKGKKHTASAINMFLLNNSKVYQKNIEENKTSLLIMHSCETGKGMNPIAQQLSETAGGDLLVIAPSEIVSIGVEGEKVSKNGSWNVYYRGKIVGKYKGDIDFQKQLEGKDIQRVIRHWTKKYEEQYENN